MAGRGVITSLARSLDPRYATNRAVLLLMPIAGVMAGVVMLVRGGSILQMMGTAVAGALSAFGGWALTRELAPDDNIAAFVVMALAFATFPVAKPVAFLVLFTTMFLVRIVNRTAGLPARMTDSIVVSGLAIAIMYLTKSPLFGLVAALAFALDAVLQDALRRQWLFAVSCLSVAGTWFVRYGSGSDAESGLSAGISVLLAVVALAYAATVLLLRVMESVADSTGDRLSVSRVRAGMLIALLVASMAFPLGQPGLTVTAVVWASLTGVAGTAALMRLSRSGQRTGRHLV